ncbi:Hypothetical_protein [Hexamita inflata]|uniref:Hypothetical_protein n=1 Tax=Hexamita inflata TaxID=28002 RepID=A0AA86UP14_9EUKA|nr:Hypothetical protein HINF_LOCUS50099 [Hexamita inflata]
MHFCLEFSFAREDSKFCTNGIGQHLFVPSLKQCKLLFYSAKEQCGQFGNIIVYIIITEGMEIITPSESRKSQRSFYSDVSRPQHIRHSSSAPEESYIMLLVCTKRNKDTTQKMASDAYRQEQQVRLHISVPQLRAEFKPIIIQTLWPVYQCCVYVYVAAKSDVQTRTTWFLA